MVRISSLLPLLTAAVLAITSTKASPVSEVEARDTGNILNYSNQLEYLARLKSLQRRSPVTLDADIKKVKYIATEKFCKAWLQGRGPPRPTVTVHATSTKVRTAKATATVTTTRTIVDGTSTSYSTSTSVVDESAPTTSTVVISETVVVPETKLVSETTTLSFTETSTPVETVSSATPTITESPVVATETIFTTTTIYPFGGMSRRGPSRPAKPSNLRGCCDEAITKGCLLKLYGVLSYPAVTKTCTDRLTTQTRTSTVVTAKTVDSLVTASTFVVVPTVSTRTVPTTTTTSTTAYTSTTATETVNVSFTESTTTTTTAPTTTTTVLYTTTTTEPQTTTTTSVAQATATAFFLKTTTNNRGAADLVNLFFRVADNSYSGTTQKALLTATQDTATKFYLTSTGLLKTLDGTLTMGLLNPSTQLDPKLALFPDSTFRDPVTCKVTPTADPASFAFTCTAPDGGSGERDTFWLCSTNDILGIETEPFGCPVPQLVAIPVPA